MIKDDKLAQTFGVQKLDDARANDVPVYTFPEPQVEEEIDPDVLEAKEDFAQVRKNLQQLVEDGMEYIDEVTRIAASSQTDKMISAHASAFKAIIEANRTLLELHEKRQNIKPIFHEEKKPQTINNNLILTTADLQKLLLGKNSE